MANWLEKKMPAKVRDNLRTLIAAALGLFLGLRYNDYIRKVLETLLPSTNNLLVEGGILLGLTILIVYLSTMIQKALDGK